MSTIHGVHIRSPYNYDRDLASDRSGLDCSDSPDMAVQSFKSEVDINELARRFGLAGELPMLRELGDYADFSEVVDFQTALNHLIEGEKAFESLSPVVRRRFDNDPAQFWEWLHDPSNDPEAIELGIRRVPQDGPGDVGAREGGAEAPPGNPPTP